MKGEKIWTRVDEEMSSLKVDCILEHQLKDKEVLKIISYFVWGKLPEDESKAHKVAVESGQMTFDQEGQLCRVWWVQKNAIWAAMQVQLVVLRTLHENVLCAAHDRMFRGHFVAKCWENGREIGKKKNLPQ